MRAFLWILLLTALGACHETQRDNPLDPELTPAVEIVAARLDTSAGVVLLEWTMYSGRQPFAFYQILRRPQNLTLVDTLAQIDNLNSLAFTDTTLAPQVDYVYQVVVFNQEGFAQLSSERPVGAFDLSVPVLSIPTSDPAQGTIHLQWDLYRGPDFNRYEIWRRSFGREAQLLAGLTEVTATTWLDDSVEPRREYFYWIRTFAAGLTLDSPIQEAAYELPLIQLTEAALSHQSATANLSWERYPGPGFSGYEIQRRSGLLAAAPVGLIEDINQTSYIDSVLDGNTQYEYQIVVRTHWDGISVLSNALGGAFYQLVEQQTLPNRANSAANALALALDETDGLYVGSTLILTTTAASIEAGLWVQFPDGVRRNYFNGHTPHRLSAIHIVVDQGAVYTTLLSEEGLLLVGAIDPERDEDWLFAGDVGSRFPVGLFVDEDGQAGAIDDEGFIYRIAAGELVDTVDGLNSSLATDQALPLKHLFWHSPALAQDDHRLFIVSPDRPVNHVVGKLWTGTFFGGRSLIFDDGVGPRNGETLNPLVVAYDSLHNRVAILEEDGRLQIMRGDPQAPIHYLTKLGTFGQQGGQFHPSPPTTGAMAIDSLGRIYVADGAGDEGRVQIFAP
ncbi:MAG: hypothetical protein GKR89_37305 [Candidatus Latescibacteria bacterium]|nr:hypothetical protein [Candidatus Latescibacterota bacterium]